MDKTVQNEYIKLFAKSDYKLSPLACWNAVQIFLREGKALPPQIKEYLITTADQLLSIDKPGRNAGREALSALGITSGNDFSERGDLDRAFEIYTAVKALVDGDSHMPVTRAARKVQKDLKLCIDARRVYDIYKRYNAHPQPLIKTRTGWEPAEP